MQSFVCYRERPLMPQTIFAALPDGVNVSRDVPDLNAEESRWPVEGDADLLPVFEERLGHTRINQCQIAGKYMGDGYLQGGRIPWSPLHEACRSNEAKRGYLSGMLAFFYEYFEREKPDVVFCPWVDRTYLAGMVHVANSLGIPFRRIVISRVVGTIVSHQVCRTLSLIFIRYINPFSKNRPRLKCGLERLESTLKISERLLSRRDTRPFPLANCMANFLASEYSIFFCRL